MLARGPRRQFILTPLFILFLSILTKNAFAALISANPTQGPPGSAVTVNGSQWPPSDRIELSWNFPPFNTVATVQADGSGNFTAAITVPSDAPIGTTRINAINEAGDITWQAEFTVTAVESQLPPKITNFETFHEGDLVFFRLFFDDPNNNAQGFGFRGAKGSAWAEETHPFSSPSYGRVSPGIVEYPFNHLCETGPAYESDVEAWIYGSAGLRSSLVTVHLACQAPYHCSDAAFQFPLIDGWVGWLYTDTRSNGYDPSGDHTGIDIFPPVQDETSDVYPLAAGILKSVNRENHSTQVYYPDQGVTSYMAHIDLKSGLKDNDLVSPNQPLGNLEFQSGNTHLHFSLKHTGEYMHYNDQQAPTSEIYPGPMLAEDPSDWFNANLNDPNGAESNPYHSEYPYYRRPYQDFCR
jgi:hypothetical protein